jgi:hypothetical protein
MAGTAHHFLYLVAQVFNLCIICRGLVPLKAAESARRASRSMGNRGLVRFKISSDFQKFLPSKFKTTSRSTSESGVGLPEA